MRGPECYDNWDISIDYLISPPNVRGVREETANLLSACREISRVVEEVSRSYEGLRTHMYVCGPQLSGSYFSVRLLVRGNGDRSSNRNVRRAALELMDAAPYSAKMVDGALRDSIIHVQRRIENLRKLSA